MMRITMLTATTAAALTLAGCYTPQQQNTANGAVLGGATGALIGGLASGRAGGALAGGALGAATGAILGSATTPRPTVYAAPPPPRVVYAEPPPPRVVYAAPAGPACARFGYDAYGNQICLQYYAY